MIHNNIIYNKKCVSKINNPEFSLNIELYKVFDIDIKNKKILVKLYNQKNPIWLEVNSNVLSKTQYKLISRAHVIDSNGIYVLSEILNNTITELPPGIRRCYQCEFDEFIVENDLVDEAITNGIVWETVSNYLNRLLTN